MKCQNKLGPCNLPNKGPITFVWMHFDLGEIELIFCCAYCTSTKPYPSNAFDAVLDCLICFANTMGR